MQCVTCVCLSVCVYLMFLVDSLHWYEMCFVTCRCTKCQVQVEYVVNVVVCLLELLVSSAVIYKQVALI